MKGRRERAILGAKITQGKTLEEKEQDALEHVEQYSIQRKKSYTT